MKVNKKIPVASLRVLEILRMLTQKPCTTQELLEAIEKYTDDYYSKETIAKYISTLKIAGFRVRREKEKYYFESGLEKISLNENDLSVVLFIRKHLKELNNEFLTENVNAALQIVEKGFSMTTLELLKNNEIKCFKLQKPVTVDFENTKKYENFCKENLKLKLQYKKDKKSLPLEYKISPKNVVHRNGKALLIGHNYETNEYKDFVIQNITEVQQLPQQNTNPYPSPIAFKLKDRLKTAYVLKTNEKVLESGENYIIVSNLTEDRNLILRRLLRYGNSCEILYPKIYREQFLKLIDEVVEIYAE